MRILYISTTSRRDNPYLDPSTRYRCYNNAQELFLKNITVDVISYHFFKIEMISNYDYFIFHRPPNDNKLYEAIEIIKAKNKFTAADYDDLIFGEEFALQSSLYLQGRASEEECLRIYKNNYKALMHFDNIFASTIKLQEIIKKLNTNANVYLLHNGLSSDVLTKIKLQKNKYLKIDKKIKNISYLSGTASHNKDFEIIEDVLADLSHKYKDKINIILVGPLDYNVNKFVNISSRQHVSYEKLFDIISQTDINLAPLVDNIFNKCKSGLKFIESGVLKVPSVVTPIPDMKRFETDGISFANTEAEWYEAIESLIIDDDIYNKKVNQSYSYIMENCLASHETKKLLKILGIF